MTISEGIDRIFTDDELRELAELTGSTSESVRVALARELIARREAEQWRPIAIVPDDGFFLVHEGGAIRLWYRSRGYWEPTSDIYGVQVVYEPTHWRPIPSPPSEQE